jgi:NAD(P)-dependent dehydrogenase (short-subunit alcohol dehydrogenase family)
MKNQVVIVTGAASGIGLACAKLLLEGGAKVVAFDIQEDKMHGNLPKGNSNLLQIAGDISNPKACENVVSQTIKGFGKLDALIHWGAAHSSARWDELDADECNNIMNVNVTGTFLMAQAAAKPMAENGKGSIVLCTSTSVLHGVTGGEGQGGPAYVASKGAVIALTRSLARALGPKGVRINAVSPGITETAMIKDYSERQRNTMKQRFPLGRFAEPNEIAEAGLFLISEKASFMTGEIMHVNGGSNFG